MIPTADEIEAARTPAGGWTKETLAAWGVEWPPQKGWKAELLAKAGNDTLHRRAAKTGAAA